jgi:hypothetical protein
VSEGKFVKRFGTVPVEKGFITPENLYTALKVQIMENFDSYDHRLIGQILVKLGYMPTEQFEEVLKAMGK